MISISNKKIHQKETFRSKNDYIFIVPYSREMSVM
jgi:hypothetical protein